MTDMKMIILILFTLVGLGAFMLFGGMAISKFCFKYEISYVTPTALTMVFILLAATFMMAALHMTRPEALKEMESKASQEPK